MRLTLFLLHIMRLCPQPDEFYASKNCWFSLKYILKCSMIFGLFYVFITDIIQVLGTEEAFCIESVFRCSWAVLIYHEQSRLHYTYERTLVTFQTNLKPKLIHPERKQARSQVVSAVSDAIFRSHCKPLMNLRFAPRSYNRRLISVCGHSALLMKQPPRCVEKRATVDRLPEDGINRYRNASGQQLVREGVTHGCSTHKLVNKTDGTLPLFATIPTSKLVISGFRRPTTFLHVRTLPRYRMRGALRSFNLQLLHGSHTKTNTCAFFGD